MLKHVPTAVDEQHVHIRQPIVRHDDAHPAALGPPAAGALEGHDPARLAGLPEDSQVANLSKRPIEPTLPTITETGSAVMVPVTTVACRAFSRLAVTGNFAEMV